MGWLLLPKRPVAAHSQSKAQALLAAATLVAGVAAFAVVQDRITAAGARRYVAMQRAGVPGVTIQAVMEPAIHDSVRKGALAGGSVMAIGLGGITLMRRRRGADD